ncbi:MAG: ATP-grasp domain-containing protein [Dehalococcoidia bacterium]|nr:MAG: ATP-grasp domain-containing protein [Dehalococcoidia bacterium]
MGEESAALGVLEAVKAVTAALSGLGYSVQQIPLLPPLEKAGREIKKIDADLVFNLFEGFADYPETEAAVAYILSDLNVPFTGCQGSTLSLALDKVKAKSLLQEAGIYTPRYQVLNNDTLPSFYLHYPCIVKPCAEDASHGITKDSVVVDFSALKRQVSRITAAFNGKALVEEYIEGHEFNITVLGNEKPRILPITEIAYSLPSRYPKILAFPAKWERDSVYYTYTQTVCPAEIDYKLQKHITDIAVKAFRLFDCTGYARIDFRVNGMKQPYVIEINPNPDISPGAGVAIQAEAGGMSYKQLVEKIVLLAMEKA